jgi:hypothetical protein
MLNLVVVVAVGVLLVSMYAMQRYHAVSRRRCCCCFAGVNERSAMLFVAFSLHS